ncbi:MAG: hypothetical protein LBQ12_00025 [Deltaproteobacteria bacterium]|nr:hypothetical protein [Deltaproteobacteria bacterium]
MVKAENMIVRFTREASRLPRDELVLTRRIFAERAGDLPPGNERKEACLVSLITNVILTLSVPDPSMEDASGARPAEPSASAEEHGSVKGSPPAGSGGVPVKTAGLSPSGKAVDRKAASAGKPKGGARKPASAGKAAAGARKPASGKPQFSLLLAPSECPLCLGHKKAHLRLVKFVEDFTDFPE